MSKKAKVYVKEMGTGKVVHTVEVPLPCSERQQELLLSGMLRNMNTDCYFVDDEELDKARASTTR